MKKVLILALCFGAMAASGQRKFGIIAGIDNPFLTEGISEAIDFGLGTGIQLGIFYEIELSPKIHFRPALVYSQQGDRATESTYFNYTPTASLDYHMNYLNVPLDIKFWNKVYVVLGPQVGMLISESAQGPVFKGPARSSFDFGANLALGLGFKQTFVELGVYQGFVPVVDTPYWKGSQSYYNALARFSIGWRIL